jgi:glycosyltransferase involved in cell wall biosynthesis
MKSTPLRKVFMSTDAVGGVWTYAMELARGLAELNIDVDLAVLGPAPAAAQRQTAERIAGLRLLLTGLSLDWTARSPGELEGVAERLKALADASGADLVHLNAPAHAGLAAWQQPLVVAAHSCVASWWRACGSGPLPADLAWRAERTAAGLGNADAIIVPSQSFASEVARIYGQAHRLSVVYNARCAPRTGQGAERSLILTAGRLWDRGKNVGLIDRAAALLIHPIHAAGETTGANGESISLVRLRLLGALAEGALAAQYARTKLFVSMSRYEPFGLSVLEAAQAGCPLILSDIATFRELWGGAATFVPSDDAAALAHSIDELARDRRLRLILARRARERARQFTPRRLLAATLQSYRDACAARPRRQRARHAA